MIEQCPACFDFTENAAFPTDICGWHFCPCGMVSVEGEEVWTWKSLTTDEGRTIHPRGGKDG